MRLGTFTPLRSLIVPGNLDDDVDRLGVVRHDAQPHLAVVDQKKSAGLGRLEDLGMGQGNAPRRRRCGVEVEAQLLAHRQLHRPLGEGAEAELGPLQVHQDGDGMLVMLLERAQLLDPLAMVFVHAVAEVEAEHVGAGLEQSAQALGAGGRGPQGRDDLGETLATHLCEFTSWATTL